MNPLTQDDNLLTFKYGVKQDPFFSVEKNNQTIARTIAKCEKRRVDKMKLWDDTLRERSEAIASFLKHVDSGRNNNVDNYFGRTELARLRGEDILTQIKSSVLGNAKT